MNVSCDVILDLIPLVKDNVASEDSVKLVKEHLNNCGSCKRELESGIPVSSKINDKKIVFCIKGKLFVMASIVLLIGASIGIVFSKGSVPNYMPVIVSILSIILVGAILFRADLGGDKGMRRFFIGRATVTIVIFAGLAIYLLMKYAFRLF